MKQAVRYVYEIDLPAGQTLDYILPTDCAGWKNREHFDALPFNQSVCRAIWTEYICLKNVLAKSDALKNTQKERPSQDDGHLQRVQSNSIQHDWIGV